MKLALLALLTYTPAFAAELPAPGDLAETVSAAVSLHSDRPGASLGEEAPKTGFFLRKGDVVRVLDTRNYAAAILGPELWLEVQKVDDPAVHGWVLDVVARDAGRGEAAFTVVRSAAHPAEVEKPDARSAAAAEAARRADALVEEIGGN
jgi:hypothetical protein